MHGESNYYVVLQFPSLITVICVDVCCLLDRVLTSVYEHPPAVGGLAQWLGCRISDQVVLGSSPDRCTVDVALSKSQLPPA